MLKLTEFKTWLGLQGLGEVSIKKYLSEMIRFNRDFTEQNVNEYYLSIAQTKAPNTVNFFIKAISKYRDFEKTTFPLPKYKKTIQKIPITIDYEYIRDRIIPTIELVLPREQLKVKTILYILFFTGMRRGELIQLKRSDFDLENNRLKVLQPKVGKEKFCFYPKEVKSLLEAYFLSEIEEINAFNTSIGTISYYFGILKPYFKDINLTPHLLRHSFCTELAKKGINIKALQELAGHSSITTTEKYIHFSPDNLQSIYNIYNNIKQLNNNIKKKNK